LETKPKMNFEAYPALLVYKYKNTKIKLIKTTNNIKFNKMCLRNNITPKYAVININSKSKAAYLAQQTAQKTWIKQEINSLYIKKINLNNELYKLHLELLNSMHPAVSNNVLEVIKQQIKRVTSKILFTHNKKLRSLHDKQQNNINIRSHHTFYRRIANLSSINLTNAETILLSKGLSYNLPRFNNNYLVHEVVNAEATIRMLSDTNTQNEARTIINNKLNRLLKFNNINQRLKDKYSSDYRHIRNIKDKMNDNNVIITKADKGNTVVLLPHQEYINKIHEFIVSNKIETLAEDPTKRYVKILNETINKCTNLLDERTRRYIKPIHAQAPQLTGLPKLHKQNIPIRPLINYTTAPSYKIAKLLQQIIKNNINLENDRSIKNNIDFVNKIKVTKLLPQYKIASFDIENLYTNVPVTDTIDILKENLIRKATMNTQEINELIILVQKILKQNYFTFNGQFYSQSKGLAMGSPLSGILAELYLNHFENKYLLSNNNIHHKNIIAYHRYVDDTFCVFNGSLRQLENMKKYMNSINNQIRFTLETEDNNCLNFLDLTLIKQKDCFKFNIYRKPTTTNITIHADSYHPWSQKMAAYNAFVHRLLNIPLDKEDFIKEIDTIKSIAITNGYRSTIIDKLIDKHRRKKNLGTNIPRHDKKFISVEYTNLIPQIIKNQLKKYNITVTFRTNNNIQNVLQTKRNKNPETCSGIYKIVCDDCDKFYIGQTGRGFKDRYIEHLPKKNIKNIKSSYAQHLIEYNHNYTSFAQNLKPLHYCKKGRFMDAMEEFIIYKASKLQHNELLNDMLSFKSNVFYDTIIRTQQEESRRLPV
jgi:hypothetical protein